MTPINYKLLERISELSKENLKMNEIVKIVSKEFSMKETTVRGYFYRHNIKRISSNENKNNQEFFDNINSEAKAYLLGFFIADGTIYKKPDSNNLRMCIHIHSKDRNVVEYYNNLICPNNKISITKRGHLMIRWNSLHMGKTLIDNYNIQIRKTFHLDFAFPFDKIPENLQRHFIRGFFDGDGGISSGKTTIKFYFYSTSKLFLNQISEIFEREFDVIKRINSRKRTNLELHELTFVSPNGKKETMKKIYDWFYENSNYFLFRKKEKLSAYLNTVLSKKDLPA